MERKLVAQVSLDEVNSRSRVHILNDIVSVIHEGLEGDTGVYFHIGEIWYNNMLICSEELNTRDIDPLMRAVSNATQIAFNESANYSNEFTLENEEDGYLHITSRYFRDLEDTDQLARVSYTDGEVTFVLKNDPNVEYLVVEG